MRPTPKCVLDRSRPCTACIAPDPRSCPYPYLLAEDSEALDEAADRPEPAAAGSGPPPDRPHGAGGPAATGR